MSWLRYEALLRVYLASSGPPTVSRRRRGWRGSGFSGVRCQVIVASMAWERYAIERAQ